ncbi:MAG TPA: N-acetylmuramoyl-L-alanine amidase [Clostridia bacterium]|nr:N-acetylmuramoyl-L-alanine amidase [Clostridia bacterium]
MFSYVTDLGLVWPKGRVERTKTDHIQIHHTVGDYGTPAKWKKLHESRYAAGNKGVSYSYLVLADGTIYEGRGHQYSHGGVKDNITNKANQRSISIAFNGDMRKAGNPTEAAKAASKRLINDLMALYNVPVSAVIGHNEEPVYIANTNTPTGKFYATLCPCIDMKAFRAYLAESVPVAPPVSPTVSTFPAAYGYTGSTYTRLRNAPKDGAIIGQVNAGDEVIVLAILDGWAEVVKHEDKPMLRGWCSAQYLERK